MDLRLLGRSLTALRFIGCHNQSELYLSARNQSCLSDHSCLYILDRVTGVSGVDGIARAHRFMCTKVVLSQTQREKQDCEFLFQVNAVLFSEAKGVRRTTCNAVTYTCTELRVFILTRTYAHLRLQ